MRISKLILCTIFFLTTLPGRTAPTDNAAILLMEKGDSCRDQHLYNKALAYYLQAQKEPSLENNTETHLQVLERIMCTYDVLYQWKELSETSYQLYMLAKKNNAKAYQALAFFMRGKRLCLEGHLEEGFRTCFEAVEQLKDADHPQRDHKLGIFYAFLTKQYGKNGNYKEALRMSKEQERYHHLASQSDTIYAQMNKQRLYTIRAWLLAKMGRLTEADKLYKRHHIVPHLDPISGDALPEYYQIQGMDEEALRFLQLVKDNMRKDEDTLSRNMQRVLGDEGDVYYRMGDYQKAAECYRGVAVQADTLGVRTLRTISSGVQQVIDSERAMSRHNLILSIVIVGSLMLLVVFFLLLRHNRVINRKNRAMTQMIRELMHYRDIVVANGDPVEIAEKSEEEKALDEEEKRFKQMDKRVMKEELFRAPDFGRDELMRLMGVDKNAISVIISRYTGMNVTGYVNTKRMEYAVLLMRQHPEYTMGAIAEACGIKSPATFIRNFRNVYGMTPSEFRQNIDE